MPRKRKHPPPDQAIASSPLFRLSPEVRNIVYTYVLVDSDSYHPLFIPTDFLKRRKKEPAYRCKNCRQTFNDLGQFSEHELDYRNGERCKPPAHTLPAISTTLLCCCRLINTEAASLLYRANTFYFDDPYTLQQFHCNTAMYSELSDWLEEITLQLSDDPYAGANAMDLWQQYIIGSDLGLKSSRLSKHFPHLKRLTIILAGRCLLYETMRLQRICDAFGQNLRALDWVHIVGLNSEDVISSLKPMVCQSHSQDSKNGPDDLALAELETVQTHATEYECAPGWKNVTLWRGSHESRPPFIPNPTAGIGRERKHLCRIMINGTARSELSLMMNYPELRTLKMEQNKRLLQMAEQQANHKPEDVALQQELEDLRMNVLCRVLPGIPTPVPPASGLRYCGCNLALQDYQAQSMVSEIQKKKRLRDAQLDPRRRRLEQEDNLHFLEIWARYASDPRLGIAQDISQTEGLIRQLEVEIKDAAVPSNSLHLA
ncbi:MAG: hypothetical protein Q9182_004456 [Xanthomendoza sp. 2 TL-2023]